MEFEEFDLEGFYDLDPYYSEDGTSVFEYDTESRFSWNRDAYVPDVLDELKDDRYF